MVIAYFDVLNIYEGPAFFKVELLKMLYIPS